MPTRTRAEDKDAPIETRLSGTEARVALLERAVSSLEVDGKATDRETRELARLHREFVLWARGDPALHDDRGKLGRIDEHIETAAKETRRGQQEIRAELIDLREYESRRQATDQQGLKDKQRDHRQLMASARLAVLTALMSMVTALVVLWFSHGGFH